MALTSGGNPSVVLGKGKKRRSKKRKAKKTQRRRTYKT